MGSRAKLANSKSALLVDAGGERGCEQVRGLSKNDNNNGANNQVQTGGSRRNIIIGRVSVHLPYDGIGCPGSWRVVKGIRNHAWQLSPL